MSPSREITGQRPAPLKIHKDSHIIHKSSSSSSSLSSSSTTTATVTSNNQQQQQQQRRPVIIYTHSPKVIHTQAQDFMALVQKLTGMSRSDADKGSGGGGGGPAPPPPQQPHDAGGVRSSDGNNSRSTAAGNDDSSSSSENSGVGDVRAGQLPPAFSFVSPVIFDLPPNPYLADIPLFTPNSPEFLCSAPMQHYRYPDSVFSPPNVGSSISPSAMDVKKLFRDY